MRVACAAASSGVLPNALVRRRQPMRREQRIEGRAIQIPGASARLIDRADAAPQRRRIAHETLQRPHGFGQAVDEGHAGFVLDICG